MLTNPQMLGPNQAVSTSVDLENGGVQSTTPANSRPNSRPNSLLNFPSFNGLTPVLVEENEDDSNDDSEEEKQSPESIFKQQCNLLNEAIETIGWGRYQWQMFFVAGFGWFVDNMFMAAVSATLPTIRIEFNPPKNGTFLGLGQQAGLLIGALVFGLGSDVIGRRKTFFITLAIVSIFGFATAWAPNYVTTATLMGVVGLGVGGNMPNNSAMLLEFLPKNKQYMLTVLSIFWSLSSAGLAGLSWPLLLYYSCPLQTPWGSCARNDNRGWRWLYIVISGLTFLILLTLAMFFDLHESPKYLLARGKMEEAVAVVDAIAQRNNKTNTIFTVPILENLGKNEETKLEKQPTTIIEENEEVLPVTSSGEPTPAQGVLKSPSELSRNSQRRAQVKALFKDALSIFSTDRIKMLFDTKQKKIGTSLLFVMWIIIAIGWNTYNFFLPTLIAEQGIANNQPSLNTTYRNFFIIGCCQIPGSLLAGYLVERPFIGRKGTLAGASVISGALLFGLTQVQNQNAALAIQCCNAVMQNIIWGVMYSFTSEIFPSNVRGTGTGLCSCLSNAAALFVPVLGYYSSVGTITIYICGALFVVTSGVVLVLPYESQGKASM